MKTKLSIMLLAACLCYGLNVTAQDTKSQFNPIEHAVISQTIAPDARAAGMGDVGVATDPDVNSQYWNPAKYPFCISRAGLALNYTPWLRKLVNDIDLAYVAGYYRIGDYASVSGSLRYFSLGEVMTSFEENAMTVKPYEMSIDVGASLMREVLHCSRHTLDTQRPALRLHRGCVAGFSICRRLGMVLQQLYQHWSARVSTGHWHEHLERRL